MHELSKIATGYMHVFVVFGGVLCFAATSISLIANCYKGDVALMMMTTRWVMVMTGG